MAKKHYASGGYIEKHPSGSYTKVSASGTVTKYSASGYREVTSPGGSKTIYHVSGRVERKSPWNDYSDSNNTKKSRRSKSDDGYKVNPKTAEIKEAKVENVPETETDEPRFSTTKTAFENDIKESELKKYHKTKKIYNFDAYSFTDPKTGEEKWLAYANPSVVTIHDNQFDSDENFVVLGINDENNVDDWGRAIMNIKGYQESDLALLYEVVFDKNGSATINTNNCFVVHIKTGEMIPLTSRHLVHFSDDGERMRVLNPFAPSERYDIYSTRVDDKMLQSYVNPNEMI